MVLCEELRRARTPRHFGDGAAAATRCHPLPPSPNHVTSDVIRMRSRIYMTSATFRAVVTISLHCCALSIAHEMTHCCEKAVCSRRDGDAVSETLAKLSGGASHSWTVAKTS